jgi:hypothetical protein
MLQICNQFALEYDLIFNTKKSLAIKYGDCVSNTEHVFLGDDTIKWVDNVRHLGNFFNTTLTDALDCKMKCSSFIGAVNKLMSNFGHLQPSIIKNLFKSHCCSFYGSPMWNFNSPSFKKICTTWNIGVRTILKLPYSSHTAFLGPLISQHHLSQQLYVRSVRFMYNMYHSSNLIVRTCFNHAMNNANSCIGAKLAFIRNKYGTDITKCNMSQVINRIYQLNLSGGQQAAIDNLETLISVRSEQSFIEGFDSTEVNDMIQLVATL